MQGMDLDAIARANMTDRSRDAAALVPQQQLHDARREARRLRIKGVPMRPVDALGPRLRRLFGQTREAGA